MEQCAGFEARYFVLTISFTVKGRRIKVSGNDNSGRLLCTCRIPLLLFFLHPVGLKWLIHFRWPCNKWVCLLWTHEEIDKIFCVFVFLTIATAFVWDFNEMCSNISSLNQHLQWPIYLWNEVTEWVSGVPKRFPT